LTTAATLRPGYDTPEETSQPKRPATRTADRNLPEALFEASSSLDALVVAVATAAGATGAALARLTDTGKALELVAATGISDTAVELWRSQSVDDASPLAEAARSLRFVFARGGLLPGELDTGSAVALPLTVEGHPVGVLGLDYAAARTFGKQEHEWFASLATSASGAFDRALRSETGDRARHLQELASQLAVLRTRGELAEAIVAEGAAALGAVAASVAVLDAERRELHVVAAHGYSEQILAVFDPLPIEFEAPLADAVRTGDLIAIESPEALDESYPDLLRRRGAPARGAVVAIPLAVGDEPFGALGFDFEASRLFDDDTCAFMLALSRLCAQALDRVEAARLYDRTARLQLVAGELARSVSQADVARVILHEALTALGASGGRVAVVDPVTGALATIAVTGYPDELFERLRDTDESSLLPVAATCISGEPVMISSLDDARSEWPVAARAFGELGHRAAAAVPLRSHHGIIGALAFTWEQEQPFGDEDESFLGALAGLCSEALERSRLYEASEQSRMRLRHVLDRLGEAVIEVDSQLNVTYANEEGMQLFGDRALVGKPLPDLWPEVGLRDLARFQLDEAAEPIDERTPLADGRTFEVTAMHEDGEAVIVLRDVSRRERQERAEREFVANAAHELRTPLAAIATAADALERGAKDLPAERDFYISGIVSEIDRLVRLSDALLLLARVQADPGSMRRERVELEPILTDVAARLDVRPGVRVVVKCGGEAIQGERALVEGALANLTRNASRHTTTGSITLSSRTAGNRVVIEVADTGTGMSDDVRARAAARFFRGGERSRDGFGLGLAIAQEMVQALEGELEISARRGGGTSVKITLGAA